MDENHCNKLKKNNNDYDVAFSKLTSSTSDMLDPFCRLSYNDKTIIAKLDIISQGHVVPLGVKNGRDVRVTQRGEECVRRVRRDGSGTTSFFTTIF